jgi:signal transduction histidine kinase
VYTNGIEEIITDKERLGIILRNIIGNSIKYANRSADSYIKCELEQVNSTNIIRIKDNGIGIEESQMDKVFNMFHRGSVHSDGSGLGLYIARETAKVLGGEITISSKCMEFTELRIELPNLHLHD